ncbi:hypothetical protein BDB01DRAFT_478775 [Pilobolus umbonatus]|nr:hypothetical protein BDB01DRAFT_478775 [Pilobolus umbonatus]
MSNYTGNNYILSLAFYEGEVIFHLVHEKDSTCADTKMYNIMGSGCIYNEQSELLRYNHKYSLLKDPHYEAVANKTAFYTPCIIREYHNSYCQQRNEKNALIETVFWQYIKALFNQIFKSYEDLNYQISNLLHWALIVPDNWDNGFIDIVKKRLITIELAGLTDITIAKISDSVLSYIQIPHFKYSFVNGDYYIVCLFTEYDNATVYSYEIGPPIKGLDNIAHYTLKYSKSFSINYITEEYMLDTIFEGKKEEANKYNLDIKKLIDLCHGIYMQNNLRCFI